MSKAIEKKDKPVNHSKAVEEIPHKSVEGGKTAQELMNKHLKDKNDVITDDDFKNMKIDLELPEDEAHQPLAISNDPDRPKDEDKDPKVATPWDIIN